MGTSTSKPFKTPESSRGLHKALKFFQKIERVQTKFFVVMRPLHKTMWWWKPL